MSHAQAQPKDADSGAGKVWVSPLEALHLCVQVPDGMASALDWLDAALVLRTQLQSLGVQTTLARQRLRGDRLNLVLGVDAGWDIEGASGHRVAFVCPHVLMDGRAGCTPVAWRCLHRGPVLPWVPWVASEPVVSHPPALAEESVMAWPDALHGPERQEHLMAATSLWLPATSSPGDTGLGLASSLQLLLAMAQGKPVTLATRLPAGLFARDAERTAWLRTQEERWGQALVDGHEAASAMLSEQLSTLVIPGQEDPQHTVPSRQDIARVDIGEHALRILRAGLEALSAVSWPGGSDSCGTARSGSRRLNAAMSIFGYRAGWLNVSARSEDVADALVTATDIGSLARDHGPWDVIEVDAAGLSAGSAPEGHVVCLAGLLASLRPEHGRLVVHVPAGPGMGGRAQMQALTGKLLACWYQQQGVLLQPWQVHLVALDAHGNPCEDLTSLPGDGSLRWVLGVRETVPSQRSRLRSLCADFGL
jgi:hypothetical protein